MYPKNFHPSVDNRIRNSVHITIAIRITINNAPDPGNTSKGQHPNTKFARPTILLVYELHYVQTHGNTVAFLWSDLSLSIATTTGNKTFLREKSLETRAYTCRCKVTVRLDITNVFGDGNWYIIYEKSGRKPVKSGRDTPFARPSKRPFSFDILN